MVTHMRIFPIIRVTILIILLALSQNSLAATLIGSFSDRHWYYELYHNTAQSVLFDASFFLRGNIPEDEWGDLPPPDEWPGWEPMIDLTLDISVLGNIWTYQLDSPGYTSNVDVLTNGFKDVFAYMNDNGWGYISENLYYNYYTGNNGIDFEGFTIDAISFTLDQFKPIDDPGAIYYTVNIYGEENDSDGDGILDGIDPDDDNDGMPDEWEIQYTGLDQYRNDSDEDLDLDGITNQEEFLNRIDPTVKNSIKPLNVRIGVGNQSVYLSWLFNLKFHDTIFEIEWGESGGPKELFTTNESEIIFENLNDGVEYEFLVNILHNGIKYPADQWVKATPRFFLRTFGIVRHSPILLIPGTGGKATAWDNNNLTSIDMKKHLENFGLLFGGELLEDYSWKNNMGYGPLDHKGDFYTCNYPDPCGGIANNYLPTKNFVDAIRLARGDHSKVTLVGQSLGGLRARAYLQKKDRYPGDNIVQKKIERLVTIGTPHLGVLENHEDYEIDIDSDGQRDIWGVWQILLGNAPYDANDFYDWNIGCSNTCDETGCTNYRFQGGYILDSSRYTDGNINCNNIEPVRFLLEYLRDGLPVFGGGGWDFTGQSLMVDVISGSPFMNRLNCWIDNNCNDSPFGPLPEGLTYRYAIGISPGPFGGGLVSGDFLNYFLFKDTSPLSGDGFISRASQDLSVFHNGGDVATVLEFGKNHLDELRDVIGLLEALDVPILRIVAKCPVYIEVESPSGLFQSKNYAGIFGARYSEADIDGDGEIDKFIEIPLPEQGDYSIKVTPEPWADPSATYSLEIEQNGIITEIKKDEPISSLNGTPEVVSINAMPIANAGPDQVVMENESGITTVTLDGSESYDAGSTDGTNDDIVSFEWYIENNKIGDGETIAVDLEIGEYQIKLFVTDQDGLIDEDSLFVTVALPGDLNLDENVSSEDLAIFTKYFGCTDCTDGSWWLGDIDQDGDVDAFDMVKLMEAFEI
jgi:pimeloyl-ACP methyl ester carboxylesterase